MLTTLASVLMVQSHTGQMECDQLKNTDASPFFGHMTDESIDISVTKQLVLYGRLRVILAALFFAH